MTVVLGVDGCRGGWCVVPVRAGPERSDLLDATVYASFEDVLGAEAAIICVDIPIGLLDVPGQRACDTRARRLLGRGRASSVFPPPSRRSLSFADYGEASEVNLQLTGRRLNKQSFHLAPKVREVDLAVTPQMQERVREAHPELGFWALNGQSAMRWNKKTREGRQERWRLLREVLPGLPDEPPFRSALPAGCELDDYVDALACAWTAMRVTRGVARPIPDDPETDGQGLRMEIWMPG